MDIFISLVNKVIYYFNSPEFISLLVTNRFYMILLVIVLLRMKQNTYRSMWACALINIPGTFLHELMHFMVGAILNARPVGFTILPKKSLDGGYVMGSVSFSNIKFYNAVPSALAPLLLLPIGFYLNRYWLPTLEVTVVNYILYVLLQTIIIENSLPSSADYRVARLYKHGLLLYAFLFCLFLYFI